MSTYSQDLAIADSLLAKYKNEAIPYFNKIAKKKTGMNKDKTSEGLYEAHYIVLMANTTVIKKNIEEALKQSEKTKFEKQDLIKIIDLEYQKYYPELPKEFWENISEKTKNL